MIHDQLSRIEAQIATICRNLGRDPEEIALVGVSKYADSRQIKEAVGAGLTHIGENKVQEAAKKFSVLEEVGKEVTRHMIGHLQTNKVKQALLTFDMIQSVDSLKLATEIDKQAHKLDRVVDILIQVNTSGEEQKYGLSPQETAALIEQIINLKHIRVLGLMTIAPLTDDEGVIRRSFQDLKSLSDQIKDKFSADNVSMKYLSMGMTNDFKIALEEGSNMLRIGRAIFSVK